MTGFGTMPGTPPQALNRVAYGQTIRFGTDKPDDKKGPGIAPPKKDATDSRKPPEPSSPNNLPNPLDLIDWSLLTKAFQQMLTIMGPALDKVPAPVFAEITKLVEKLDPKQSVALTGEALAKAFGKDNAEAILEALKGNPVPLQDKVKENEKALDALIEKLKKDGDPTLADALKKGDQTVTDPAFQKIREMLTFAVGAPAILNFALMAFQGTTQTASKIIQDTAENPKLKELAKVLGMKSDELSEALSDKFDPPIVKLIKKLGGNSKDMKPVSDALAQLIKQQLGQAADDQLNNIPMMDKMRMAARKVLDGIQQVAGTGKKPDTDGAQQTSPAAPTPSLTVARFLKQANISPEDALTLLKQSKFNPNDPIMQQKAQSSGYPATDLFKGFYDLSGLPAMEASGMTRGEVRLRSCGLDKAKAETVLRTKTGLNINIDALRLEAAQYGLTLNSYVAALQKIAEVKPVIA